MTTREQDPEVAARESGPGELGPRELGRWAWRQLTSMRTALVLLLLLALAAIPGSVIPQSGVDALAVTRWKEEHPDLTPIYEKLDLFSVYDSIWFSAIYLLLVLSLVLSLALQVALVALVVVLVAGVALVVGHHRVSSRGMRAAVHCRAVAATTLRAGP